jgi:hypothetical protein
MLIKIAEIEMRLVYGNLIAAVLAPYLYIIEENDLSKLLPFTRSAIFKA